MVPDLISPVPGLSQQAERPIALGVHEIGGLSASELRAAVAEPMDADGNRRRRITPWCYASVYG